MSDTEDDEVEAPKIVKPKRQQTEAQKENFRKALMARAANVAKRNETKDERIINKKLTTLATKAEKLKAKIVKLGQSPAQGQSPKPPVVQEVVDTESESDADSEPEIVIIKQTKKPKKPKKRIVVVEPASDSDSEPEEVIQKAKPRPKLGQSPAQGQSPKPKPQVTHDPKQHVVLPRVNNLRFY